ncbi:MAG: 2-oxo acid dehydrogenase subunit E2 [Planctomycetes bacterium]|nr:2-oxo acid dehydrogenase subunit E2 [Planctomycetota bacterium]
MYRLSLGESSSSPREAIVAEWLKSEGQVVTAGDSIVRLETGDANLELTSAVAGTVRQIAIREGLACRVGQVLCYVGDPAEPIPAVSPVNDAPTVSATASAQESNETVQTPTTIPEVAVMSPDTPSSSSPSSSATTGPTGQVIPILMPQAGQSMEEGTVLEWKVAEGDSISTGQIILEIETDKANMDVEAVDSGRLAKIVAQAGDIVEVKVPIAYLADNDADVEAFIAGQGLAPEAPADPSPSVTRDETPVIGAKTASSVRSSGRVKASPAARKLAAQKNIDLNRVSPGSGPGGRVLTTDLASVEAAPVSSLGGQLSKMRRAIARNLLFSKQTIPHFYAKATVDAQRLYETYGRVKSGQFKCTINDFVVAACARSVREFEPFRGQFQADETIKVFPDCNIGLAVGTEDGLTVPVVLHADRLTLDALAAEIRNIVEGARRGKMANVGQGVFTITNLGMFGVESFQAIINPPESAILAVGALREDVKVENGAIKPTRLMALTLSVDHRVIDGVVAARFLARVRELLETPEQLV